MYKGFVEISRLYTQNMPNTFLNSRGHYSNIDHFLIGNEIPWREIEQVNIICTHHERLNMASSNWKTLIKGNWDFDNNTGDHRPVTMKLGIAACREFLNKL
jgi:hypothetical protein